METTPPPPSLVQIAVSNPESELSVPTRHILVKDIVSVVIAEEDIKTEEVPKSVQSFVAKFAETDGISSFSFLVIFCFYGQLCFNLIWFLSDAYSQQSWKIQLNVRTRVFQSNMMVKVP